MHVYDHNTMERTFHMSFLDSMRDVFSEWSMSLSAMNAAAASGKAVELLRQGLVGRYGISDITVHSGGQDPRQPEFSLQVESYEPLTDQTRLLVQHQNRIVNGRFGTNISLHFVERRR